VEAEEEGMGGAGEEDRVEEQVGGAGVGDGGFAEGDGEPEQQDSERARGL
jgi:hypothetical protein